MSNVFWSIFDLCRRQNGFLSGESEFDPVQLESAKSSVIFEIIEREKSAFDAAKQVGKQYIPIPCETK